MSEDLAVYLAPRSAVPTIGPESGRVVASGIAVFRSPHGSVRYVLFERGRALAALQIVTMDGQTATIANVYTLPEARRRGLARRLLERARKDFRITHSAHLSESGRAWKAAVGDPGFSCDDARRRGKRMKAKSKAWEVWSKGDYPGDEQFIEAFSDKGNALRRIARLKASQRRSGMRPYDYELRHRTSPTRRHFEKRRDASRRKPVRIPKAKRAAVSRKIGSLVKKGYSPRYAAEKAYHGRDPSDVRTEIIGVNARHPGGVKYLVKVFHPKVRGYDLVDVIAHDNGATSTTSAKRSTVTPHYATRAVKAHIASGYGGVLRDASRDPLSSKKLRSLRASQFALPKRRALPINDASHTRNAASRLEQMRKRGTVTASEYRAARKRIVAASKRFKKS